MSTVICVFVIVSSSAASAASALISIGIISVGKLVEEKAGTEPEKFIRKNLEPIWKWNGKR